MSEVSKYRDIIESQAQEQGVDPDLVKAIVHMETTHGQYDVIPALVDANTSILPMSIRSDYWEDLGYSREQLKQPESNIKAGVLLLKRISERVQSPTVENIATLYNDLVQKQSMTMVPG